MAKFSSKDKIQAVKRYLEGTEGGKTIANSIGVHPRELYQWIKRFEFSGEKAFEKRYTTYSLEYKLDVIHYMNENGTSIFETAAIFNLPSDSTLWNWQHIFETQGLAALEPKKKGPPSMKNDKQKTLKKQAPAEGTIEALKEENESLRMENAYLKKLNALVQNKEKLPNKTKHK